MRTFVSVMLLIASITFKSITCEGNYTTNNTKRKLKMAYLIPWTGQFPVGKTMGPVILQALENVRNRDYTGEIQNVTKLLELKCS